MSAINHANSSGAYSVSDIVCQLVHPVALISENGQKVCGITLHFLSVVLIMCVEYLQGLLHPSAVCDRCMQRITGEWFRCVYCAIDLCDNCEAVDTHNYKHFFMVFKSTVSVVCFLS